MKLELCLSGDLEGLDNWRRNPDTIWHFVGACQNCQEQDDLYVDPNEVVAVPHSRGEVNLVQKCKLCERVNTVSIISSDFHVELKNSSEWCRAGVFDCRGVVLESWIPQEDEFMAEGVANGTAFLFTLEDGEYYDVDETEPVSVVEVEFQIHKIK